MSAERFYGHDQGLVITQPQSGKFVERSMTQAELSARAAAAKIADDIYRHANYAGVCYIELWGIIAKAGQEAIDAETMALRSEVERLSSLINNAHTTDFLEAVRLEAAHQRERWDAAHDIGKDDAAWFWLIGYLAGKAMHKPEKQLHHIITTAAACLNWHAHKTGASASMRPGIAPPAGVEPVEPCQACANSPEGRCDDHMPF